MPIVSIDTNRMAREKNIKSIGGHAVSIQFWMLKRVLEKISNLMEQSLKLGKCE